MYSQTIPKTILIVCLGNICRSPAAQAVLTHKCANHHLDIIIDSAGTVNYHQGESPDPRAIAVGRQYGYALDSLRASHVQADDFGCFELILAMDHSNLHALQTLQNTYQATHPQVTCASLFLFDRFGNQEVADPYYAGVQAFVAMFEHVETAADAWLAHWQDKECA